jgi:hypothetical protein
MLQLFSLFWYRHSSSKAHHNISQIFWPVKTLSPDKIGHPNHNCCCCVLAKTNIQNFRPNRTTTVIDEYFENMTIYEITWKRESCN